MRLHRTILAAIVPTVVLAQSEDGLILRYPLNETSGTTANDASGSGNHGTIVGGPQLTGPGGVRLDGIDDHIRIPDGIMAGLTSMTISVKTLVRAEQTGAYFIFGLGNSADGVGNGYVFATGNPYRAAISSCNWACEAVAQSGSDLPRDTWKTLTYVLNSTDGMALYLDDELVSVQTDADPQVTPESLEPSLANYIGRSQYTNDNHLAGSVRDFRLYNRALSAAEAAELVLTDEDIIDAATASLTVTNVGDIRGNIHLPTSWDALPVAWMTSSSAISADGIVTRNPNSDTAVTLTATVTYNGLARTKAFEATVAQAVTVDEFEGYVFSYFTGNSISGEKIYFAASNGNNALDWTELNGGEPYLESTMGTTGLRDPFIIRSPEGDTFYLIATDLSIGSGTSWGSAVRQGSRYLEVWESHDLVNWSEQRHCLVSEAVAGNTWAPEAYYDEDFGAFVVFWASSLYAEDDPGHTGTTYHRMMYVTTRDFVTFSAPEIWQDAGLSRIDSTILKDGDTYYRFTKDEGGSGTGCSDIIQESSNELMADLNGWTVIDFCIGRDADTSAVEGPTAFKSNPNDVNGDMYYLFVDEYGNRGYIPLETDDISNGGWTVASSYSLPSSPRHGTVMPVTAQELAAITAGLGAKKRAVR